MLLRPGYQSRAAGYAPDPGAAGYGGAGYAKRSTALAQLAALIAGGGDAIAAAMDHATAPIYGWAGSGASAPVTVVGAAALSGAGTPTYGQENAAFNVPVTTFDVGSTDSFFAGDTTPCNPGDTSFAWLFVGTVGAAPGGGTRNICGCRGGGGGGNGWDFAVETSGAVRFGVRASGAFYTRSVAGRAASDIIALGVYDKTATDWGLFTDDGDDAPGGLSGAPPAGSTSPFAVGNQFLLSSAFDFGLFAWWDAGGEGLGAANVAALKSYLGWS